MIWGDFVRAWIRFFSSAAGLDRTRARGRRGTVLGVLWGRTGDEPMGIQTRQGLVAIKTRWMLDRGEQGSKGRWLTIHCSFRVMAMLAI
jgi:hypothetical protein